MSACWLLGIAYGIFSMRWEFPVLWVKFTPWRLFVIVSSLPCLLGGLAMLWFPESPRFLASRGRHDEALEVLGRIWSYASKRPPSEYPVRKYSPPFIRLRLPPLVVCLSSSSRVAVMSAKTTSANAASANP